MRLNTRRTIGIALSTCALCLSVSISAGAVSQVSSCPTSLSSWPSLTVGSHGGLIQPDLTIIAPHGTFDRNTKDLAVRIANRMGANVIWAIDPKASFSRRINVNRPSEMRWGIDRKTATATSVFELFSDCVEQYPSRMSIELHGDSSKDVFEMATVGVSAAAAEAMKAAWGSRFGMSLAIDAAGDKMTMSAGGNKRTGLMSRCVSSCVHIEVPSSLRDPAVLDDTADKLSEFFDAIGP